MASLIASAYEIVSDWADLSAVPGASDSFAHHGLAFTHSGDLLAFHAGQLVTFDQDGSIRDRAHTDLTEGHGLTIIQEGADELVWVADPGFTTQCGAGAGDGAPPSDFGLGLNIQRGPGRVVLLTLAGEVVRELERPPTAAVDHRGPFAPYAPTSVAVNETRWGGDGHMWVADGYGSNVVHRFDASGRHLSTLDGVEGGGRFDCPHAVFIDRRPGKTVELYVADRGNSRLAVYDLEGRFLRLSGEGIVNSPSGFTIWQDCLVVAELFARLTVLDDNDQLLAHLGADSQATSRKGWPNAWDDDGVARRPARIPPGLLNSPHAVAVSPGGDLVVAEWIIGGRYTRLQPCGERK
ncbi:hypothetical protein [Janibacter cremeus]|uniref:NHL repeat-containing protein n=1 Tax=Janibacter cremeus TaxID=1285192 RepID=A0A852VPP2_9MICO|nr:hypothetical protein [Janibacter cremeus]NYF97440.1 hypothetical protein [Janibacter cremeus]